MAAAPRAAEGGYIFPKSSGGGYFRNFSGQGGIPLPPIPDPCLQLLCKMSMSYYIE